MHHFAHFASAHQKTRFNNDRYAGGAADLGGVQGGSPADSPAAGDRPSPKEAPGEPGASAPRDWAPGMPACRRAGGEAPSRCAAVKQHPSPILPLEIGYLPGHLCSAELSIRIDRGGDGDACGFDARRLRKVMRELAEEDSQRAGGKQRPKAKKGGPPPSPRVRGPGRHRAPAPADPRGPLDAPGHRL